MISDWYRLKERQHEMQFIEQKIEHIPSWIPEYYKNFLKETKVIYKSSLLKEFRAPLKIKKEAYCGLFDDDSKKTVVFSTKYEDILGISSRSTWSSCQDIRPGADWTSHALGVLGSATSKYIGTIYITNEKDFDGRGERMFYRCLVYLMKDEKTEEPALMISIAYPDNNPIIKSIFISYLKKYVGIETFAEPLGYKMVGEVFKHKPYFDIKIPFIYDEKTVNEQLELGNYEFVVYANEKSPEYKRAVLEAIKKDPQYTKFLDQSWDEYKDAVIGAITKDSRYLQFADKSWDEYKDLVKQAIRFDPYAIRYALDMWEDYDEMLYAAIDKAPSILGYLNKDTRGHKDIVIKAARRHPECVKFAKPDWEEYDELARLAINDDATSIIWIDKSWRGYKDALKEIISSFPFYIAYADTKWDDYNEFVNIAAKKYPYYLKYLKANNS